MFKRIIHFKPHLLSAIITALLAYSYIEYATSESKENVTKWDISEYSNFTSTVKEIQGDLTKNEEIKKIEEKFQIETLPSSLRFFKDYQYTKNNFLGKSNLSLTKSTIDLSLTFPTKFFKNDVFKQTSTYVLKECTKRIRASMNKELNLLDIKEKKISSHLDQKKEELQQAQTITHPTDSEETAKDKNKQENLTDLPPEKKSENTSEQIQSKINKVNELLGKISHRIKEVQEEIKAIPDITNTPLLQLTSLLDKSFEQEIHKIRHQVSLKPNQDNEKRLRVLKEKALQEKFRLQEEAFFQREQRKIILRKSLHQLLKEENNLLDYQKVLKALDPQIITKQKTAETSDKSPQETVLVSKTLSSTELKELKKTIKEESSKLKETKTSILNIQDSLKSLSTLKTMNGAKPNFSTNPYDIMSDTTLHIHVLSIYFGVWFLLIWLFKPSGMTLSIKEAQKILNIPLLSEIGAFPNQGMENAKNAKLADQFSFITQSLNELMKKSNSHTVSVVSPHKEDGRTQFIGMLSLSFFRNQGYKIIALDTDFENPNLNKFLPLKITAPSPDSGLNNYFKMVNEISKLTEKEHNQILAKLVRPSVVDNIFLIYPGDGDIPTQEDFKNTPISNLINGIKKYVDLILIDTQPQIKENNYINKAVNEAVDINIVLLNYKEISAKELIEFKAQLPKDKKQYLVLRS